MTTDPAPAVPQDTRSLNPTERAKDDALPLSVLRRLDFHRHEALTAARDAVVSAAKAWEEYFDGFTRVCEVSERLGEAVKSLRAFEAEGGAR